MFFGNDRVTVWRGSGKTRDGDHVWEQVGEVVGCNFQPSTLQRWPDADKSDGGQTYYAVDGKAVLYTHPQADIRKGDVVQVGEYRYRVVGRPLVHTYPSGLQPGMKVHLSLTERW